MTDTSFHIAPLANPRDGHIFIRSIRGADGCSTILRFGDNRRNASEICFYFISVELLEEEIGLFRTCTAPVFDPLRYDAV